ncbi:ribosome recycling factor protein [Toxoplasma gondii ME49]|uniref:Ribosome recycling factor protein n=7 Tax=Toxoplasma gondii TaxID=5811 RepID=A0A0F7UZU3_TOXGV|nr:ribosome recycling factor protein [Toxoplasma gondii ME49]ESS32281.1 ribosome recycling factor protein [Toxoplasma gondii VEG]KFG29480.1 ribosome recycling factor protein [Toxoplasma gondii p89]KFH00625.1 ribosome recycling factor protein [Toxoplasma gondii VAND]KFH13446.1 ribosome recycling factor protein [Toxoplasma gondii MAS]KYF41783.1 ribosome recycling factor protein [Toxoplasma gondii ARI]PIL96557.1 ribosome recycling factor protein [Toxoplasma gondii COUG]|eukprot:XP_002365022.2 ribosome recycling factor protein [Toxoplasma gondii ME49]
MKVTSLPPRSVFLALSFLLVLSLIVRPQFLSWCSATAWRLHGADSPAIPGRSVSFLWTPRSRQFALTPRISNRLSVSTNAPRFWSCRRFDSAFLSFPFPSAFPLSLGAFVSPPPLFPLPGVMFFLPPHNFTRSSSPSSFPCPSLPLPSLRQGSFVRSASREYTSPCRSPPANVLRSAFMFSLPSTAFPDAHKTAWIAPFLPPSFARFSPLSPSLCRMERSTLQSRRKSSHESGEKQDKKQREKNRKRGRGEDEEKEDPFTNWKEDSFLNRTNESLQAATERVKQRLAHLRPEAASVLALEKIFLRVPGAASSGSADAQAPVSVRSIVTVKQVSPSTLALQPTTSSFQLLAAIEKALSTASLGLSVRTRNADEKGTKRQMELLVDFPPLTQERRLQLVSEAKAEAEEGRVVLRRLRRDLVEELRGVKKAGGIGEDRISKLQDRVQQVTEKKIAEIDSALASKEKQLRTV